MSRHKSPVHWLLSIGVVAHIFINIVFSLFLLNIANVNYPGGVAIARLHRLEPEGRVSVHICNLAAQTGVSRFTQLYSDWKYDKTEFVEDGSPELYNFTHLIVEAKSKYSPVLKMYSRTHNILDSVEGFSHISINYNSFPPVKIKTKQFLYILKLKKNFILPSIEKDINLVESLETSEETLPALESILLQKDEEEELDEDKGEVEVAADEVVSLPVEIVSVVDSDENVSDTDNQSVKNEIDDSTNVTKDLPIKDYKSYEKPLLKVRKEKNDEELSKKTEDVENIDDKLHDEEIKEKLYIKDEQVEELKDQQKEIKSTDNKTNELPSKKIKHSIKKIIESFKENDSVVDVENNGVEESVNKKTESDVNKKKLQPIKPKADGMTKVKTTASSITMKDAVIAAVELNSVKKSEELSKNLRQSIELVSEEKNVSEEPEKEISQDQKSLQLQLEQLQKLLQLQQQQLELLLQQQKSQVPPVNKPKEKKELPKEPEVVDDIVKKETVVIDPAQLEEYEERKKRTKLRIKNIIQNLRASAAPIDSETNELNLTAKLDSEDLRRGSIDSEDEDENQEYFKTEIDDEDYGL